MRCRLAATAPDQLWVADITYIPTWAGVFCLTARIDMSNRCVVDRAMATHLGTALVLDALDMAPGRHHPLKVVHHPDQYTSIPFGNRCQEAGVPPSMGSVGDRFDNAATESFFASLKCELLDYTKFRSQAEARMAVFDFIESFHNMRRRHSNLGYLSPLEFERRYALPGGDPSPNPSMQAGLLQLMRESRRGNFDPNQQTWEAA